ncbi:MAG: ATP-binding protein [Dehalococcoidales bacterium]
MSIKNSRLEEAKKQYINSTDREERDLLFGILETLSQSRQISEYLDQLIVLLKNYSGCRCVGIRLTDGEGNIPYTSYTGFSKEFYDSENNLSVKTDKCLCINVIKGDTDPSYSFYTAGGSLLTNRMTSLITILSEETNLESRNVCDLFGFESVALVPMRHKGEILGLIQLADENANSIPPEKVRFLEQVGAYIGEALRTFVAEEMLRESESRYRDLYEEAPNAYFSVSIDGYIEQANHSATQLFGYSIEELIGRPIMDLYADSPDGKIKAEELARKFLEGEAVSGEELEINGPRGRNLWVSLSVRPIKNKEGQVVASRLIMVNITEHKKLDQLKDDFIGLVSHELRTPMTVITGAVNTALTEADRLSKEDARQLLMDAAAEADSLSHILTNLMELSRVQAKRLFLHVEPVSVAKVIQATIDEIKRFSVNHKFVTDIPGNLPALHADGLRLERILYNLLENAVKYSPEGGEIRVLVRPEKEYMVIQVIDQGIGIALADRRRLFGAFQRLEEVKQDGPGGVGLGLLVCRRLVEAHGGEIWVESEPGSGSTFFFTIPLTPS